VTAPALVDRVRERLASAGAEISSAVVAAAVRAEAGGVVSDVEVLSALRLLHQEFTGAGPLEPLLRDSSTTDVLVTAPDAVWVDRGDGLVRTDVRFADEASVTGPNPVLPSFLSQIGRRTKTLVPAANVKSMGELNNQRIPVPPGQTTTPPFALHPLIAA